MNLLLVTFELSVTSRVLAWQARLARALAARSGHVVALTESLGDFHAPANMTLVPVPRAAVGPLRLVGAAFLLNPLVYRLCRTHHVDVCLVHMAAQWAYRLRPALALAGVPSLLWYAHGTVSRRLRLAHACVDRVVTSTPEGFRLPSSKVRVIGQGIDTDTFGIPWQREPGPEIVYVGRIGRRKRLDLVLDVFAAALELDPQSRLTLRIVGPCLGAADERHRGELRDRAGRLGIADRVSWEGHRSPEGVASVYRTASVHLNLSETGSMDKTVLEALACGCPVLTNNPAFGSVLAPFPGMFVPSRHARELAGSLLDLYRRHDEFAPGELRRVVLDDHGFDTYVGKLLAELADLAGDARS